MKLVKTIAVAIFFIVAITFALQNQQLVALHYYDLIPAFSVPLFLLVFFSILLGILIAGFGDIFVRYSLSARSRRCERELKHLKEQMVSMKQQTEKMRESEGSEGSESSTPLQIAPPKDA